MHTTQTSIEDGSQTMEVMDVQVSRGSDTSRMAFETIFEEAALAPVEPYALDAKLGARGGVSLMAYDQRFANNEGACCSVAPCPEHLHIRLINSPAPLQSACGCASPWN